MLKQMKNILCILLAALFVVSLTAVAVSAEPVLVKEKKIVAIDTDSGQIKAAKGMGINRETGNYKDGSSDDQADIEMPMKYLEDDS